MIPHLVRVQVHQPHHRAFRLWIPVLPLLIVLSPLLLLAVLGAAVACLIVGLDPVRTLVTAGRLLCALKGTRVEIDQPDVRLLLDIR